MLNEWASNRIIHKTRHHVRVEQHVWEIDVFHGANEGLIIAEIELTSTDERLSLPSWVGEEVTEDHRYSNSNLSVNFSKLVMITLQPHPSFYPKAFSVSLPEKHR